MASLQYHLEQYLCACVRRAFRREHPVVVGIAGSVGKSSTKTAIGIALGAGEEGSGVVATEKNYNTELGVPMTVFHSPMPRRNPLAWSALLLKATSAALGLSRLSARTYVLELGTDRPGELPRLVRTVEPTVGVLTAIGPEHTEFFGSIEGVAKEESAILRLLQQDGFAVINADDRLVRAAADAADIRQISFGTAEGATVRILSTKVILNADLPDLSGLEVVITMFNVTMTVLLTGTVGKPQAFAAAAALACAAALDQDERLAMERLRSGFHGMPGRMRLLEGIKQTWLIDDSYNSSPLAAASAIEDLSAFPLMGDGRRIAAMGDMLELGTLAESSHREMGRAVGKSGIDIFVACGTLAHVAAKAATDAGMSEEDVFTFATSAEAGRFIQDRLKPHDVVLIKGSQGSRMERICKELMAHPDKAEKLLVRHTKDWLARA